jgi:hypothetical protein
MVFVMIENNQPKNKEIKMKVKTVTCFLVAFFLLTGLAFAEPVTVLNPSFEYVDGELILWYTMGVTPDYWTFASGNDNDGVEDPSTDGDVCVAIGETDSVYQLLEHKIYPGDEYALLFDAYYIWSGGGQTSLYEGILYYDNNGSRVPIASAGGMGALYMWILDKEVIATIPSGSPAMGKRLGIELAADQSPNNWFGFDNIRLEMTQSVMRAENPYPVSGADRVLLDAELSWATGRDPNEPTEPNPDITQHFVYMNNGSPTDPNMTLVETISAGDPPAPTASFNPSNLERDKTYFWRVDEGIGDYAPEDPRNVTGFVWSFKTVLSVPMFDPELPGDVQLSAGETAIFAVDATNPYTMDSTGMSYAWRKVGEATVLSTSDTLEITGVQISDEGDYYCTATIDGMGLSADSKTANLLVKRLMGHWKFEGDLTDEVGGRTGIGDNSFVGGIDGQAVQFTGDGRIVQIPDTEEAFNFYPKGYTVSAWAKTTQAGWGALIAKQDRGETWKGIVLNHYTSSAIHTLRQGFGDLYASGVRINDDQWHLITASYESQTCVGKIYVDGVMINESEPASYEIETNDFPLIFGAETVEGDVSVYLGLMDEVKIWNYPVDKYEIADMYLEFNPGQALCVEPVEYDLNGDCVMDLEDITVLANNWLGCNIVPTCFE